MPFIDDFYILCMWLASFCCYCSICQLLNEVNDRGSITDSIVVHKWRYTIFQSMSLSPSCVCACFCPICAVAVARGVYDGSNPIFNCFCTPPVITRSLVRRGSGIREGGVLCDCLACFVCCFPCYAAQLLLEVQEQHKTNSHAINIHMAPQEMIGRT